MDHTMEAGSATTTSVLMEELPTRTVTAVEEILGYVFHNKELMKQALTHRSYYYHDLGGISYEGLEFIGDTTLNFVMSTYLYKTYPGLSLGLITRLRSANTDTEKLARATVHRGLHRFLRHREPILNEKISEFSVKMDNYTHHSNGLIDAPKVLENIIEALAGAVYVDSNYKADIVWKVFRRILEPYITLETMGMHPVSELFEYCQKKGLDVKFEKDQWQEDTSVEVYVGDKLMGSGRCKNKKEIAQNRAAKNALENLKKNETTQSHETMKPPPT